MAMASPRAFGLRPEPFRLGPTGFNRYRKGLIMPFGISPETATDIAVIYRDIQAAEELLADVHKALDRFEQVDIRDVFGRRKHTLELGIPSGDNGRRILHVPYALAVPVIQATIAEHRAKLAALNIKAKAELAYAPNQEPQP